MAAGWSYVDLTAPGVTGPARGRLDE
ncbi:hypothetical protein LCGC14_2509450, partial [marine sediment metagenome]